MHYPIILRCIFLFALLFQLLSFLSVMLFKCFVRENKYAKSPDAFFLCRRSITNAFLLHFTNPINFLQISFLFASVWNYFFQVEWYLLSPNLHLQLCFLSSTFFSFRFKISLCGSSAYLIQEPVSLLGKDARNVSQERLPPVVLAMSWWILHCS